MPLVVMEIGATQLEQLRRHSGVLNVSEDFIDELHLGAPILFIDADDAQKIDPIFSGRIIL